METCAQPTRAADGPAGSQSRCCEVCGSTHRVVLRQYSKAPWQVAECRDCGFVYLAEVPAYDSLIEEYAWERTFKDEKERRNKRRFSWFDRATRWRLRPGRQLDTQRRRRMLSLSGNVLDIGCGEGCRVPEGPIPHGIEISAALARAAEPSFARRGGRVINAPAIDGLDAFADDFFSAILMRSYLEHESHPRRVLETAIRKLVPGGRIYVRLPNYGSVNRRIMGRRWCGFRYPDHVNYFTTRSLRALAESVGFRFSRTNRFSPFDDNIIAVLQRPARA